MLSTPRYSIVESKLDKDHPLWPDTTMYKIHDNKYVTEDNKEGYVSCTGYLKKEYADRVVNDLNNGIGWIT